MDERAFNKSINRAWEFIDAAAIGQVIASPSSLETNPEFRATCLRYDASYEEAYLCGMRNNAYNILLEDYSFLQFTRENSEELRYAYYPNPYLGDNFSAQDVPLEADFDDDFDMEGYLQSISEIRNFQRAPVIRYEYVVQQYVEVQHPCAHFHVGQHSDNRWSVRRILKPETFALIVLKQFYRNKFNTAKELPSGARQVSLKSIYLEAKANLPLVHQNYFSREDEKEFYWG